MKDVQTSLMVIPVEKEHLGLIWNQAAEVLEKSAKTTDGKFEVNDILVRLVNDTMVLWVVIDDETNQVIAAITTRIIDYPRFKALAMDWIGGSRMNEWLPVAMEKIKEHAKLNDCKHLEGYGRKAWGRWLRKYNWKPEYIAYKMEL
jgi:hypothetical protein